MGKLYGFLTNANNQILALKVYILRVDSVQHNPGSHASSRLPETNRLTDIQFFHNLRFFSVFH